MFLVSLSMRCTCTVCVNKKQTVSYPSRHIDYNIPLSYFMLLQVIHFYHVLMSHRGRGNSTVSSVSVCHAVRPGSRPVRSAHFRKVVCCHCVIDSLPPVPTTGSKRKAVHVSLCLCNDACKRSLAICHKSRALCPVSRLLSVPIWPACAKQGRKYDSINQSIKSAYITMITVSSVSCKYQSWLAFDLTLRSSPSELGPVIRLLLPFSS